MLIVINLLFYNVAQKRIQKVKNKTKQKKRKIESLNLKNLHFSSFEFCFSGLQKQHNFHRSRTRITAKNEDFELKAKILLFKLQVFDSQGNILLKE